MSIILVGIIYKKKMKRNKNISIHLCYGEKMFITLNSLGCMIEIDKKKIDDLD
jgi:hypothetical protein